MQRASKQNVVENLVGSCLVAALLMLVSLSSAFANQTLKIGVYQNPPSVFFDENTGKVQGFYIDVLEHIAELEGWTLDYHKATWPQLVTGLETGEIDMIAGMAFSADRDRIYDFTTEPVFINWGQVYVRDTNLQSLLDLTNRKIVGLKDDIYTIQFRRLLDQFALPVAFTEVSSYEEVMKRVESGEADAGITSRSNGQRLENAYQVYRSPIVCCSREVHYAVLDGKHESWLRAIDHHLQELKSWNGSEYFAALDRWYTEAKDQIIPPWILWSLAVALSGALILAVLSIILRQQVRDKTASLREAYRLLETRVKERTSELSERNSQLLSEIYEHRKTQEKLQYMVRHDPLTGLPNRRWFSEQLMEDIKLAGRNNQMLAVMFLDLDKFKEANDTYGHDYGDLVLVSAAERVRDALRESDKIARLGGDEFIIILPNIRSTNGAKAVADKVLESFDQPFIFEGISCSLGVSIGISLFPLHSENAETLLAHADTAMYQSKKSGRNCYTVFEPPKKPKLEIV